MKHVMVHVTPNQTAKTVAKFLYQGYISIFGAPARLLSDWGVQTSWVALLTRCVNSSAWRSCDTISYHPQTNWLVESSHQTIMQMIGEAGRRQKGQLARTSGWTSACLQCHPIHHDGVQSTLSNAWMQAKAPSQTFNTLPLGGQRSQKEVPLPSMWINTWLLSETNWGLPSKRPRCSQQQKTQRQKGYNNQKYRCHGFETW